MRNARKAAQLRRKGKNDEANKLDEEAEKETEEASKRGRYRRA